MALVFSEQGTPEKYLFLVCGPFLIKNGRNYKSASLNSTQKVVEIKTIMSVLVFLVLANIGLAFCPETYVDGDVTFQLREGSGEMEWMDEKEYCGQRGYMCIYDYYTTETYFCGDSLEKKMICNGQDSTTITKLEHRIIFYVHYVTNEVKYDSCPAKRDYCSGDVGWVISNDPYTLGGYSQVEDPYMDQTFNKYYEDSQVNVLVDAGKRIGFTFTPETIEARADELAGKVSGAPCAGASAAADDQQTEEPCKDNEKCEDGCKCDGKCMPNEPFADINGCVDAKCNDNGQIDEGEDCRFCEDAACTGNESLCVPHDEKWVCLEGAKTYSSISDLDEGYVFVKRWTERDVLVPLTKDDRLMQGDEIIIKKTPDRDRDTYVEITWDDGKKGAAILYRRAGELYGSFFVGESRNKSSVVVEQSDGDFTYLEEREVFPKEDPTLIEMYGDDARDLGLQILINLPQVPAGTGIIGSIALSPTSTVKPMTFINVKSDILLEPTGDGNWTLYTFEGAPEVIRVDEEGNEIDKMVVEAGKKALVSPTDKATNLEEFNPGEVKRILGQRQADSNVLLWVVLIAIILAALVVAKKIMKK